MTITLDSVEVREALVKAMKEKTKYLCSFNQEDCYFSVHDDNGEVPNVECITFSAIQV